MRKRSSVYLILAGLVLSAGIIVIGHYYYRAQVRHIRESSENVLESVAKLKVSQIADWRNERIGDAIVVSQSPFVVEMVRKWLETGDETLENKLVSWFRVIMRNFDFSDIVIIDRQGKVRLGTKEEGAQVFSESAPGLYERSKNGQVVFGDFHKHGDGSICIDITAPLVLGGDGTEVVGVIAMAIDPYTFFYPFIQSWPTPSRSSETLLVRREKDKVVFLNELRHKEGAALTLRLPIQPELPAGHVILTGRSEVIDGYDYRDVKVLAAVRPIEGTHWFMVAKTDADEVFAELKTSSRILIGISAGLIVMAAAFIILVFNMRGKRLYKELYLLETERIAERKKAEETLRESEARLKEAQRIGNIGSWELDLVTNELVWSDQIHHIFETDPGIFRASYEAFLSFVHPDDRKKVNRAYADSLANKSPYDIIHRVRLADNSIKYVHERGETLYDAHGKALRSMGTVQDITRQRQTEEAFLQSEAKMKAIFKGIPVPAYTWRKDGEDMVLTDYNDEAEKITKGNVVKLVGIKASVMYKDNSEIREELCRCLREKIPIHREMDYMLHTTGERKYLAVKYAYVPPDMVLVHTEDITERKLTEKELQTATDRLVLATRVAGIGIWDWDLSNNQLVWNGQMYALYDVKPEEFSSNYNAWKSRVHPDDVEGAEREIEMALSGEKEFVTEFRVVLSNGEIRTLNAHSAVETDMDGKPVRMLGINLDITEQKQYEQKLIEAKQASDKANRAKSEFLANMSHEIRTPMNAILGFAELLKGSITTPKYLKYLDGILSGGKTLLSLINDILDLSKIEAGKMELRLEPVNIHKLVRDFETVFSVKQTEKNLDFQVEIGGRLPQYVKIDEVRIRQILFNLIGNAFKFTNKGGVRVIADALDGRGTPHSANAGGDGSRVGLVFKIRDTGIGVPEDQRDAIFEAFKQQDGQSTRKYGGTGLGLAITKRLAEMMDGRIELESGTGTGSVFAVYIPDVEIAAGEIRTELANREQESETVFENPLILLAEDVESNREIVKGYLEDRRVVLVVAENGSEAVNMAKTMKPDLILMDMMMPVMDGYEAIGLIKADPALESIPIVALTASSMTRDENDIRPLCDDYLRKPVGLDSLLESLKKFLPYHERAAELPAMGIRNDSRLSGKDARELAEKFVPKWETASELMSNDDILGFAAELTTHAEKIGFAPLRDYAGELAAATEMFDIEGMRRLFESFPAQMKQWAGNA